MNKPKPPVDFDDNPEWTEETERRARPASEVLPPHAVAALSRNKGGRPKGSTTSNKSAVTLRLDRDGIVLGTMRGHREECPFIGRAEAP